MPIRGIVLSGRSPRAGILLLCLLLLLAGCQPIQPDLEAGTTSVATASAPEEPVAETTLPLVAIDVSADGVVVSPDITAGPNEVELTNSVGTTNEFGDPLLAEVGRLVGDIDDEELQSLLAMAEENPVPALEQIKIFGTSQGGLGNPIWDLLPGEYISFVLGSDDPVTRFDVVEGEAAAAPEADVVVELLDFSFTIPDTISTGPQRWEIVNNGAQWHELLILQPNEGADVEDILAFIQSEEGEGPPPFDGLVFVGPISEGNRVWLDVDLPAGNYIAICFLPDINGDFSPHFAHGMVRNLTVE